MEQNAQLGERNREPCQFVRQFVARETENDTAKDGAATPLVSGGRLAAATLANQ